MAIIDDCDRPTAANHNPDGNSDSMHTRIAVTLAVLLLAVGAFSQTEETSTPDSIASPAAEVAVSDSLAVPDTADSAVAAEPSAPDSTEAAVAAVEETPVDSTKVVEPDSADSAGAAVVEGAAEASADTTVAAESAPQGEEPVAEDEDDAEEDEGQVYGDRRWAKILAIGAFAVAAAIVLGFSIADEL